MNCCVIPGCGNKFQLYRVPNSGNNRFRQWKKVAPVFGTGSERICSHHFIETDFVENIRKKLKSTAIPSINLPAERLKASNKIGCCVLGCRSKDIKNMEKFPSMTSKAWLKWANILGCAEANTAGWKICQKHFKDDAFTTVTSRYLKNSAVPTKKLKRPVKIVEIHRRQIKQIPTEQCLLDHDYVKEDVRPKSNRMCSVYGCTTKTSKGVFLHKFPKERIKMTAWVHAIKSGKNRQKILLSAVNIFTIVTITLVIIVSHYKEDNNISFCVSHLQFNYCIVISINLDKLEKY
ncbi:AAEL002472-PA [Aedes aegypti]|uniref:THAP-type domain-containing protein n=2 Tax=Aedes aegypti TaxID=7159 RepID=A0A903VAD4_AEDAE|nr:uncharacterized protein LOC5572406 isoform X1 [Aedes aegypti]EAT46313.1 AAEL002472-PA [Aedes aegypti]